jgi:hypothetical protein
MSKFAIGEKVDNAAVQFTDAQTQAVVYINPEKVREVRPSQQSNSTKIEYENGHSLLVKDEDVVRKLMSA